MRSPITHGNGRNLRDSSGKHMTQSQSTSSPQSFHSMSTLSVVCCILKQINCGLQGRMNFLHNAGAKPGSSSPAGVESVRTCSYPKGTRTALCALISLGLMFNVRSFRRLAVIRESFVHKNLDIDVYCTEQ